MILATALVVYISIMWMYLVVGVVLAYFTYDKDNVTDLWVFGTPVQKLGWVVGNLFIISAWPVFVTMGVIKGISDSFR